jgi:hypothetical protein
LDLGAGLFIPQLVTLASGDRRVHERVPKGGYMAITFKVDSTTAEGTFIRVLRDGRPFGKITDVNGLYRFYEGDHENLASAELQEVELERLKMKIQSRYEVR